MRLAHAQRAALAWDRSTGMGIKCPKETLSNTRHRTQYKLEIKAAIKVIRLLGLLTPCAFLMAEAAADLLVHSLGLRSQHSPALARASSPGAVLVRQPASLLALCLFSEKNKETRSLEMLIYPFSQSASLLMARKGKQTVKHLQGLVHPCTNAAAAGVEAAACGGGRAAVCRQTSCSCTGGLSSQFKCTDEIIRESGRISDPGHCCAHHGCSELAVQPPPPAPEQQ